jgi:hypothetical protein
MADLNLCGLDGDQVSDSQGPCMRRVAIRFAAIAAFAFTRLSNNP